MKKSLPNIRIVDLRVKRRRTQNKSNRHMCQYCDKTSKNKQDLERHVATHTNLRPFKCDKCGSGFNRADGLKAHQAVHSNEKNFKCTQCPKAFKHSQSKKQTIANQYINVGSIERVV